MPTINQLPVLSPISSGDQLPVYSPNNGDARRTSIGSLLTFFQQSFASPTLAVNLFVPGSGFNITVPTPVSNDQWMLLQPASTLATGTITLPLNTGVPDGTTVLITTTQEITSLTIALNGASAIFGGVNFLGAGTATAIRFYQPTNSWYQINADAVYAVGIQSFLANPTSANLRAAMTDETGIGLLVFNTSPTLVTPALGTPTALVGTNITGTAAGLTAGNVTTNANLTGAVTSVGNATSLGSFTSANLAAALTDETGTGANVFATSPTLVTPIVTNPTVSTGTFTSPTLVTPIITNPTVSTGTFTSPTLVTPILGIPTSGTLSNCTGLPIATGVSGLAANVATFLTTPSSANLAAALTDETGTGANVFANTPTLVTPILGTPTSGVLTSCTGLPLTTGVTGALPVTNGGTGASAAVQVLSGAGAVNITSLATAFTSTAAGNALTLADGAQGQLKTIIYVAEATGGDTGVLTPANLEGATTITFNAIGDSVILQYAGTDWWVVGFRGAVVA